MSPAAQHTRNHDEESSLEDRIGGLMDMIRAQYGVIHVTTSEEERFLRDLDQWGRERHGESRDSLVYRWTATRGLVNWDSRFGDTDEEAVHPEDALKQVVQADPKQEKFFAFCDLDEFLDGRHGSPDVVRLVRDAAHRLRGNMPVLILVSPRRDLPDELDKDVGTFDYPLPDRSEIAGMVKEALNDYRSNPSRSGAVQEDEELRDEIIQACAGLTMAEAEDALARGLIEVGEFNEAVVESINRTKREAIQKTGALEAVEVSESLGDVGGLGRLKNWIRKRQRTFSEDAREFGVEPPKGVLTMGIPGAGKGLSAKAVAHEWRMPLLRLDMSGVFGSLVGESEKNLKEALKIAEALSPAILWADEVEKAFSGVQSSGQTDSGTTSRVFGHMLTWMQEKTAPVFVYFTANDISSLPPELLRKGRVDELFFLDLPNQEDRKEIFEIHLEKRGRDPASFNLEQLAEAARGYVGAEIEQGVKEALVEAFYDDRSKELHERHIIEVFDRMVPLVWTQKENLRKLFQFVREGRAVRASGGDPVDYEKVFKEARNAHEGSSESALPGGGDRFGSLGSGR